MHCRKFQEFQSNLTRREVEYLLIIYELTIISKKSTSITRIAEKMNVSKATVVEIVKKLASKGFVNYSKKEGISLTTRGLEIVNKILHKHYILETFISKVLGLDSETSCKLVSMFDLYVPDELIEIIDKYLGYPKTCPCGYPILRSLRK